MSLVTTLVDTSVLVRWINDGDTDHTLATDSVIKLRRQGDHLVVARQCIYEFWVVATRPVSVNGLGLSTKQVRADVNAISKRFPLIADPGRLYEEWLELVTSKAVSGRSAHDARLAAVMLGSGINRILTFNVDDFTRFPGIGAMHPSET
jgi:predicted nucleic acid-binding protein